MLFSEWMHHVQNEQPWCRGNPSSARTVVTHMFQAAEPGESWNWEAQELGQWHDTEGRGPSLGRKIRVIRLSEMNEPWDFQQAQCEG